MSRQTNVSSLESKCLLNSLKITYQIYYQQVFGELEKAIVVTDERGRATGDGIVEFCKKPSANLALKKCNEGCFFMVA